MVPRLTLAGQVLVLRALDGETLTFTKMKLGNGEKPDDYSVLTELQNPIKTVGLTADDDLGDGYLKLTGEIVRNSDPEVGNGFYWTELGVFAADPDGGQDILYAYAHYQLSGDQGVAYIPGISSSAMQITPIVNVFIGEIENVTAILAEASNYVTAEQFSQHTEDIDNPHQVNKYQVGLSNVPNVSTNDQTPTYSMAASLSNLSSGERLSTAFGKIARAISSFISHFQDTDAHVASADRSYWDDKADASHSHSANDINSGVLGIARGGTGVSRANSTRHSITLKDENGQAIATGEATRRDFGIAERLRIYIGAINHVVGDYLTIEGAPTVEGVHYIFSVTLNSNNEATLLDGEPYRGGIRIKFPANATMKSYLFCDMTVLK